VRPPEVSPRRTEQPMGSDHQSTPWNIDSISPRDCSGASFGMTCRFYKLGTTLCIPDGRGSTIDSSRHKQPDDWPTARKVHEYTCCALRGFPLEYRRWPLGRVLPVTLKILVLLRFPESCRSRSDDRPHHSFSEGDLCCPLRNVRRLPPLGLMCHAKTTKAGPGLSVWLHLRSLREADSFRDAPPNPFRRVPPTSPGSPHPRRHGNGRNAPACYIAGSCTLSVARSDLSLFAKDPEGRPSPCIGMSLLLWCTCVVYAGRPNAHNEPRAVGSFLSFVPPVVCDSLQPSSRQTAPKGPSKC